MDDPILTALVDPADTDQPARVRSPGVGWWSMHPRAGAMMGAGAPAGSLTRLHRRYALVLPEGVTGMVGARLPADRRVAVAYGEVLFEILPVEHGSATALEPGGDVHAAPTAGLPAGTRAVVSPTDGTFYRRPGAGAPPFVDTGARVRAGQPLGLVEVMKTFNQVLYGGPGLPEEAEIVEIRCGDAQEVRAGQILFVVR